VVYIKLGTSNKKKRGKKIKVNGGHFGLTWSNLVKVFEYSSGRTKNGLSVLEMCKNVKV
jgi:hypothetical protein